VMPLRGSTILCAQGLPVSIRAPTRSSETSWVSGYWDFRENPNLLLERN
jgi:hypothetical protein